jgi:hypothetical protein
MLANGCRPRATLIPAASPLHDHFVVMKLRFALLLAAAVVSGCATSPSGAARTPAGDPTSLAGTWSGWLTGPDMATAAGTLDAPARLTIAVDGTWTLTSSGGTVASGVSRRVRDTLVLDGTMTAGDPMGVGRAVSYVFKPRAQDALYGEGQTFFLGHRIDTGVSLRRIS